MLLAVWEDGAWEVPLAIAVVVVVAYFLVMWVGAIVWAYRDIRARTGDQYTQAIAIVLVLIFSLPGLLLYLILRPRETLADAYDRRLEAEALLHEIQDEPTCPACRRKIQDDFAVCPYCRTTLRIGCGQCGKALASTWVICPFCGADRPGTAPARERSAAAPPAAAADTAPRPRRASTATYTPPAAATTGAADATPDATV